MIYYVSAVELLVELEKKINVLIFRGSAVAPLQSWDRFDIGGGTSTSLITPSPSTNDALKMTLV